MTRYTFEEVVACNMCRAPETQFKTLGLRLNKSQGSNPRAIKGVAVTIDRCQRCGLIFPNPTPVPDSILDHYAMSAEDYWGDACIKPVVGEAALKRMRRLYNMIPGTGRKTALEVGVGSGAAVVVMEEAGFDAYGFEPIPQFLEVAKKVTGVPADRFQLAGIEDADYPPESFDLISFSAVLEHLYDPGGSITKVLKWLKPNGIIYGEVPSSRHLIMRMINVFMRLRGTNLVTNTSPMHTPFHLFEFDEESFRQHGRQSGYVLHDVEYEVCTIRHVPRIAHPLLRFAMKKTGTGLQMHVALRKLS